MIEKMLYLFKVEIKKIHEENLVNTMFIDLATDFIKTYADLTHHGKEEKILFRELAGKKLLPEQAKIMNELLADHDVVRTSSNRLLDAKKRYLHGEDTSQEIISILKDLAQFYAGHIEKEEERFFVSVADYFSDAERERIANEFGEFDRNVIHWKYRRAATSLEERMWSN